MAGLLAPDSFPIRDPRDPKLPNGRIMNPPRYMEMGGLAKPGVWFNDFGNFQQSPQTNAHMAVPKPTGIKVSHSSTGKTED